MAAVVSQYSTTGFYKAPVSKGLMGCLFITCTALNVPLLAHYRQYLRCAIPESVLSGEIWRLFTSRAAFVDTKDLVCGALLIYYFRVFERRMGSHKFASHLLCTSLLSLGIEISAMLMFQACGWDHRELPPGPYGIIFPHFVSYWFDIPRITRSHVLGAPVTGKTLTYLLGLQIASSSPATFLSALCSLFAGLLCRWNFLNLPSLVCIPQFLSRLSACSLGRLLESSAPNDGFMGATTELQRAEQIERAEQQLIAQRWRDTRRTQAYADRFAGQNFGWNAAINHSASPNFPVEQNGGLWNHDVNEPWPRRRNVNVPQPSEECVQILTDMGFDRERVLRALQVAGNDVETATTILLQS